MIRLPRGLTSTLQHERYIDYIITDGDPLLCAVSGFLSVQFYFFCQFNLENNSDLDHQLRGYKASNLSCELSLLKS